MLIISAKLICFFTVFIFIVNLLDKSYGPTRRIPGNFRQQRRSTFLSGPDITPNHLVVAWRGLPMRALIAAKSHSSVPIDSATKGNLRGATHITRQVLASICLPGFAVEPIATGL
jgi:hypothetical protein